MKNLLFILPLCFVLSCEPQGFPDLTLANLNGNWEANTYGYVYRQGEAKQDLADKVFEISFQENAQFVINGLGSQALRGTFERFEKGKLLFNLPPEAIREDFEATNVIFYMEENLLDAQRWNASGSGQIDNELMYYQLYWTLKRKE